MKPQIRPLRTAVATAVLASAGMSSFSALAAPAERPNAAARAVVQQTYSAERAACLDGSTGQDRSACLAEAAAARKEALAGVLGLQTVAGNERMAPAEPDLLANALARCDVVPADVRSDCERRITGGDGVIVSGSVAEGVIVRELVPFAAPRVVAQAPAEAQAQPQAQTGTQAQAATPPAPGASLPVIVAEPTEPPMEAEPADTASVAGQPAGQPLGETAGQGLTEGETLVPVPPTQATGLMAEPAVAPAAESTVEPLPDGGIELMPDSTLDAPAAAIETGAARGADPVAYPEWMVQQRFE